MNLYDIVQILCEQNSIKISFLEKQLKLGNGTIRKWRNTVPSGDRLLKVAKYFNVSVDYLLGYTINTDITLTTKQMTEYELYLCTVFKKIDILENGSYKLTTNKNSWTITKESFDKAHTLINEVVLSIIKSQATFEQERYRGIRYEHME